MDLWHIHVRVPVCTTKPCVRPGGPCSRRIYFVMGPSGVTHLGRYTELSHLCVSCQKYKDTLFLCVFYKLHSICCSVHGQYQLPGEELKSSKTDLLLLIVENIL